MRKVFSSRYFRLALGLVISIVSLYLVFRNINIQDIWAVIVSANPWLLILAVVVVLINDLAKAVRWQVLLSEKGEGIRLINLFVSHLAGQTLNIIFPARVGDLSRAYLIGAMGPGIVYVLFTVLLEKVIDLIAFASLFVWLILLIPLPEWVSSSGYSVAIATIVVFFAILIITTQQGWMLRIAERLLSWMPVGLRKSARDQLDSGLSSFEVLHNRISVLKLIFWTVIIWSTAVLTNDLVMRALGINLPWTASLLVLVTLQVGIAIPSVPGRIGVFEYICVLSLAFFGVGQAQALSYGILLHAIIFMPIVLLGLPFVGFLELGGGHVSQIRASKGE